MSTNAPARYTNTAIAFHWLIAILILCSAIFGIVLGEMHLSPLKLKWIAYHKWNGILIFTLVWLRLIWRMFNPAPPLPATMPGWQKLAAHASHFLLYVLMIAVPLVGWLQSSAAGIQVVWFGVLSLPMPLAHDKELADQLMDAHAFLAYTLLAIVGLHAAAAIKHHMFDRDNVLTRMLPILKQSQPG
jgi:cytochrome b561